MPAPEKSPTPAKRGLRTRAGPRAVILVINGPIARSDVPGLCDRVRILLAGGKADLVVCDVGGLAHPDVAAVDALARLQLTATRLGGRIGLRRACSELQELLALTGLSDVVPLCAG